jgi:hypothetical protein
MGCPPTLVELYSRDLAEVETFEAGQSYEDSMLPRNSGVLCEFDTSAVALIEQNARGRPISRASLEYVGPSRIPHFRYKLGTTEREKKRYAAP